MKKIIAILFSVCIMMVLLAGCGGKSDSESSGKGEEKNVKLRLVVPDPEQSSIGVSALEFANRVKSESNGSIEVQVFYNGSLYGGDASAGIKQLGAGGLDLLILSTSLYANFNPAFNVISVPYMFDNQEQFIDYLNSDLGKSLINNVEKMNIRSIGTWTRSFRQITNSKRPIQQPDDLKGVVLRVPNNPLWVEFFSATNATCTPMSFSEVYNALQLQTLDGQENPVDVPLSNKFYEVQKYISMSNHMADAWIVGINKKKFDSLSANQKSIIEKVGKDMQGWKIEYDNKEDKKAIETLVANGMSLNEITKENQQKFVEISKCLYPKFKELVKDDELFTKSINFVGKS